VLSSGDDEVVVAGGYEERGESSGLIYHNRHVEINTFSHDKETNIFDN
jgi:hypothetical protein